ncbi:uncharacterized protein PFL1_06657 [Pseudozyma flocculosa PF-1]|uniref:PIPK domain-containing protein n=1 Tax=Pseudozyma flocculosa PF-1 TaxID=1277687 RepID=A0A061H1Y0_9BASI|nr:uncharacterized protein PFL1_06657 [Pseudozyma flocculosa PF-1]EPQ25790.1 hypothetical protein PFL1_06657 [Pseudozyma flocculosa PF-1]
MSAPEVTPRPNRIAATHSPNLYPHTPRPNRSTSLSQSPSTTPTHTAPAPPSSTSPRDDAASFSDLSPTASPTSKTSNWKASIELSLATRRRLIRKPLPQLPGENDTDDDDRSRLGDSSSSNRRLEDELRDAEDWWPESLPESVDAATPANGSLLFPKRQKQQLDGGLDDQSSQHLLTILHYAALAPPCQLPLSSEAATGVSGYVVDARLLESLYDALAEALEYLSKREVLASLQRTASIRWRAEAQLRNAAAASASQADSTQGSTSKWARFAWPAAALGRAYREAQRGTLPPLPADLAACDAQHAEEAFQPFGGDPRIRKRDVAIKILSNAVWFVRNYGPAAGVETLYGRYPGPNEPSVEAVDDGDETAASTTPHRSAPPASRRVSEALMKPHGGRPNFLAKSTPTTALSGTATPEPVTEASSPSPSSTAPAVPDDSSEPVAADASVGQDASGSAKERDATTAMTDGAAAPVPAPPVLAPPSKAMEHLASLNAASGAALRAKAQAMHKGEGGTDAFAEGISQRLAHQSSRPSLRSTTSYLTEAEAAETAALEKAEREYLAMLGKGCDEWAKMVVCRLLADFEVEEESDEGRDTLKAKNSKQGQALAEQLRVDGPQTISNISTRSDRTARAAKVAAAEDDRPVVWMPEVFEGDDIFGGGAVEVRRPQDRQDHLDRVKLIGGSFHIKVKDAREKQAMSSILELAVYAGCSMILETSFLRDSDAARPKVVRVPTRTASTLPQPLPAGVHVPHRRQSTLSSSLSRGESEQSQASEPEKTSSPSSPTQSHKASSSRRWTKSLWGMLHARGHPASVDGGAAAAAEDEADGADATGGGGVARKRSLQLSRTMSGHGDGSAGFERRRSSKGSVGDGLPRSKTISQHEPRSSISSITSSIGATFGSLHSRDPSDHSSASLSSRANAKLGRLIGVFGRVLPEAAPHGEQDAGDAEPQQPALLRERRASVPNRSSSEVSQASAVATKTLQPVRVTKFPPAEPGPSPLTSSPELAMLSFYRQQVAGVDAQAYIDAFMRLQSIGFLCEDRAEGVTFATPSNGISATGELHPQVGVKEGTVRSSAASLHSLQSTASRRGHQLLSAEVRRSGGVVVNGFRREEVAFYQRLSNSRDVPLGQVVEELCVRAGSLEAEEGASANGGAATSDKRPVAPEQRVHFLHGEFHVKVTATMLPAATVGTHTASGPAAATAGKQGAEGGVGDESERSRDVPSEDASIASNDADISAVAAALRTDKEAAKTAVAVAETAVQAAERGTQVLVDGKTSSESSIWMWNANGSSGWQGRARPMSESTYLMSFARYLEAILYHPALQRVGGLEDAGRQAKQQGVRTDAGLQKQLREGRDEASRSVAEGAHLLRMFRSGRAVIKVVTQPIRVYDLVIDGPVMHGRPKPISAEAAAANRRRGREKRAKAQSGALQAVLEDTRLEVQKFFASAKQQMTALEDLFVARELDETGKTIRRNPIDAAMFAEDGADGDKAFDGGSLARSVDSRTTVSGTVAEPLTLLARLQVSLRTDEFELYDALKGIRGFENVNGIRKAFADRAKSAKNRLSAWIKKHLTKTEQAQLGRCSYDEPEYFSSGRHAFPGSQYLVRESEPLSIIAFSLSSRDFKTELGTWQEPPDEGGDYFGKSKEEDVLLWRRGIVEGSGSQISSGSSFVSSSPLREKAHRNVPVSQLDPDTDEVFYEPEPVRTTLKRKKRARETSILSLRLRRVGSSVSSTVSDRRTSRTSMLAPDDDGRSSSSHVEGGAEGGKQADEAASGKKDIHALDSGGGGDDGDDDDDGGTSDTSSFIDTASTRRDRLTRAQGLQQQQQPTPRSSSLMQRPAPPSSLQKGNTSTISSAATDSTYRAQITQIPARPHSLAGIFSKDAAGDDVVPGANRDCCAPQDDEAGAGSAISSSSPYWTLGHGQQGLRVPPRSQTLKSTRSISESVASTAASARTLDGVSLAPSSALPTPSVHASSASAAGAGAAAESPHIKHNLIHSNTKISCVSWFAEEFAALRQKWGVDDDFAHSLSRCQPWSTTGGKSKSAFFKTRDERYIGKQLLTVWSVDEKEAFLEFAPAYLRYMMNSVVNDCPTLLVKIAGVYSIKIKDIKTGETRLKMNVMVQENLWAGDGGRSVRFDLKGIKDRKAKVSPQQQQQQQQQQPAAAAATDAAMAVGDGSTTATPARAAGLASTSGFSTATSTPRTTAGGATAADTPLHAAGAASSASTTASGRPTSSSAAAAAASASGSTSADAAAAASAAATVGDAGGTVWWDSDWIGRYKAKAFVAESQRDLFCRALNNDTQFLTASNIMDYSLLLGVIETPPAPPSTAAGEGEDEDEDGDAASDDADADAGADADDAATTTGGAGSARQQRRQQRPLESSSKKALKSGLEAKGNVTILPPAEYAARFVSALQGYVVGVPCLPTLDPELPLQQQQQQQQGQGQGQGQQQRRRAQQPGSMQRTRLDPVL